MDCSMPGSTVLHYLPEFVQIHVHWVSVMLSNHFLFSPRSLLLLPSIFPSFRVFFKESALHIRWPEYWSFSFSISPSNEYSGLIPLGLTVSISLQSKGLSRVFSSTTIRKDQFFGAQPSLTVQCLYLYMTTRKTIALFIGPLSAKWCLCFLICSLSLSYFFFQGANLLISWLQSLSAVILEPKKIKLSLLPLFPPSICHEMMGPDAMILIFQILSLKPAFSLSSLTLIKRVLSFRRSLFFLNTRPLSEIYLQMISPIL